MPGSNEQTQAGEIAERVVAATPAHVPSRTLARRLVEDYPMHFRSVDRARSMVRYYRGNIGDAARQRRINADPEGAEETFRPNGEAGFTAPPCREAVPDPAEFFDDMLWGVLGDVHAPFHDPEALEIAIDELVAAKCDGIYLNGDIGDNAAFSRWFKDPRYVSPKQDMDCTRQIVEQIASLFPRKVFKLGNHDAWYRKWLVDKAEQLAEFDEVQYENLLRLESLGYEIVEDMQWAFLGKCPIFHGHELAKGFTNPVNPARGAFLRVNGSAVVNHYHQASSHVEKVGVERKTIVCRSLGCLCSLRPSYQSVTKWSQGFATVRVRAEGKFDFTNRMITEDREVVTL